MDGKTEALVQVLANRFEDVVKESCDDSFYVQACKHEVFYWVLCGEARDVRERDLLYMLWNVWRYSRTERETMLGFDGEEQRMERERMWNDVVRGYGDELNAKKGDLGVLVNGLSRMWMGDTDVA